jgi:hypothetical protein
MKNKNIFREINCDVDTQNFNLEFQFDDYAESIGLTMNGSGGCGNNFNAQYEATDMSMNELNVYVDKLRSWLNKYNPDNRNVVNVIQFNEDFENVEYILSSDK